MVYEDTKMCEKVRQYLQGSTKLYEDSFVFSQEGLRGFAKVNLKH